MCAYACMCVWRARARARVPFCVAACLDCLRVCCCCVAACLRFRLRACVYQSLDRSIYAARFSFLLDIRLLHPLLASLPQHSLPPPALVVTLSPSLFLLPLPLCLSLSRVYSSLSPPPPVPAFSNPITLISYPVIRRLIDYFVRNENYKRDITRC